MLLRCSRVTEEMNKLALATPIAAVGNLVGRVGKGTGQLIRGNNWKWGKRLGGGAILAGATGLGLHEATKGVKEGLGQENFELRQAGLIPGGVPKAPSI